MSHPILHNVFWLIITIGSLMGLYAWLGSRHEPIATPRNRRALAIIAGMIVAAIVMTWAGIRVPGRW